MIRLLLVALAGTASAGVAPPQVTIGVNVGDVTGSLGGIEPKLKWQTAGEVAGFGLEGGVDVTIKDVDDYPSSFWGKVKKSIGGADISVRGDVDSSDLETVDLDVRVSAFGTAMQLIGKAGTKAKTVSVSKAKLTKDIDISMGGTLTLTPTYDFGSSSGDVRLGYGIDNTAFQLDVQKRKLTVSHSFLESNQITPSITADGAVSLAYSRSLESGGKVTTTWTPNDSIKVQWSEGGWDTTVHAPMEGYYNVNSGAIKVTSKRSINML